MKIVQKVLEQDTFIKDLYDNGLISPKIFFYRNIWIEHDLSMKRHMTKMDAVHFTAAKFDVSYMTVYRALKVMNSEFVEPIVPEHFKVQ